MFQDGILKLNHLLFDELFKGKWHLHVGVLKNCMLPWGVAGKDRCCCRLVIKIQEGKDIGQP
jgi:hypothetical protein